MNDNRQSKSRLLNALLAALIFLSACQGVFVSPRSSPSRLPSPSAESNSSWDQVLGDGNSTLTATVAPTTITLRVTSHPPGSTNTNITEAPTVVPSVTPTATPMVEGDAEPFIFTGIGIDQKCGHGDIVAFDGHSLHATPRILPGNSNFLELLPEGSRVDILDCRLWTDQDGLSWLAVRTAEKKLGWMLVQPDKFYVTIYPIVSAPPRSLTGIPAGTAVAYVPPSECRSGPVTNEAVATSIGVDFVPVVGDLKGLGEATTGCDMVTGEELGNWRWLGLLGLVGLAEVALLRHTDEAADSARMLDNLDGSLRYSDEATMAALRNADTASDVLRNADHADEAAEISGDVLRHADQEEVAQALAKLEQPCSFDGSTQVATALGPKPISQVEVGELVLGYDETLAATGFYTVTATFAHLDAPILTVGVGQDELLTTDEHPFYVDGEWVPAAQLEVGDLLATASGRAEPVTYINYSPEPRTMYNLTVATAHTYFVGEGPWLVHNACSRILRRRLGNPPWDEEIHWQAHHLVPGQWEDHNFVIRATNGGWDIDAARNGIALPKWEEDAARLGLPAHRGSHRHYSSYVLGELDALEQRALANSWSDRRAAQEMDLLSDRLRQRLMRQGAGQRLPF